MVSQQTIIQDRPTYCACMRIPTKCTTRMPSFSRYNRVGMPAVVAVAEPSEPKPQTKPSDSEKGLIQPEEVRHFSFSPRPRTGGDNTTYVRGSQDVQPNQVFLLPSASSSSGHLYVIRWSSSLASFREHSASIREHSASFQKPHSAFFV